MIVISLGIILFEAALLTILVRRVARYNATADFFNLVCVVGGTIVGGLLIDWQLMPHLGYASLAAHAFLLVALLIWLTGTNPVQAAIITGIFFAVKIALALALEFLLSSL